MTGGSEKNKGQDLEELLRAYFLRAGFFVVRNVPFVFDGENLTDVDLWLYEKPTGTTRRVQIVDIKGKSKPKAMERLFWTRGLAQALGVNGAYVATTDKRASIRDIAKKLELIVIDGTDLQRIKNSESVRYPERLTDGEIVAKLVQVDKSRQSKELQTARIELLRSLSEGFGRPSLARSLANFTRFAKTCVGAHPSSHAAKAGGRLAYLAAAIACQSIDYISIEAPFRSADERRELLLNAVRYGALDRSGGLQQLRLAVELIRTYAPGAAANAVESGLKSELESIPAEIIAEQAARMLNNGQLFSAGRDLEAAAYNRVCPTFDQLSPGAKSLLGAFLDFAQVRRDAFASALPPSTKAIASSEEGENERSGQASSEQGSLFKENGT